MAISTCVVSGTIKGADNNPISGISVKVYPTRPFFHSDGTLIDDYSVTTTTDSNGQWSLTLIETESVSKTLTVSIDFITGSVERHRRDYTITVPNSASANFSDLASGQ